MSENKKSAVTFLQMVAAGNVREAFKTYTDLGFIHHNFYFHGDAESIIPAMEENAENNPEKSFEVLRAIEEGETVAVHSYVKQDQEDLGAVLVHIFRFQGDRIVEMWDVGQVIPENSPNENGAF